MINITILYAEGNSNWTQEWWDNKYQTEIIQQQQQEINSHDITKCDIKLKKYHEQVKQYPNSVYYSWKLQKWTKKCK